jgi:hypothetical protein
MSTKKIEPKVKAKFSCEITVLANGTFEVNFESNEPLSYALMLGYLEIFKQSLHNQHGNKQ